LTAYFLLYLIA